MKSIGLKRGTVKLLPFNKNWAKSFEKEKKHLTSKLKDLVVDIQHIGSTSIPGMTAKPIVDIAIGVKTMKGSKKFIKILESAGYKFINHFGNLNTHLFFVKGEESNRTHYIHLIKYQGKIWQHNMFFRDYLSKNKSAAKKYINLKQKLAVQFVDKRKLYTAAKGNFIKDIFAKQ